MGGSQVYLKQGETFPVRALVAATMVHSANDAAMALAQKVGGTEEAFVRMMNKRAKSLGLTHSEFHSPHGLPAVEGEQDDVMSPHDLAVLGIEVMKYPELRKLAQTQTMPFRDGQFTLYNPNHLLNFYPGATGIKTGYHEKAGFCVTASAHRDSMNLVAVVMGCRHKEDSFRSAADLMTEAFTDYRILVPVQKGEKLKPLSIQQGVEGSVPAVAARTVPIVAKRSGDPKLELVVSSTQPTAPISKGQQVGWIVVRKDGNPIARIKALAAADVAQAGWFSRTWDRVWPW